MGVVVTPGDLTAFQTTLGILEYAQQVVEMYCFGEVNVLYPQQTVEEWQTLRMPSTMLVFNRGPVTGVTTMDIEGSDYLPNVELQPYFNVRHKKSYIETGAEIHLVYTIGWANTIDVPPVFKFAILALASEPTFDPTKGTSLGSRHLNQITEVYNTKNVSSKYAMPERIANMLAPLRHPRMFGT